MSEMRMSAWPGSGEGSLPGLQMAVSLRPHMILPQIYIGTHTVMHCITFQSPTDSILHI